MPPSQKELMWGLHQGGIRWEGVVSQGGLLLGLLLGLIGAAHGGSYRGVKKEIFLGG